MKIKFLSIALMSTMLFAACGGESTETTEEIATETTESAAATTANYNIDASASSVLWKGEVAGVYNHVGFVKVSNGTISTEGGAITGGEITLDMNSIAVTDTASFTKMDKKVSDLEGHLAKGDFFNTAEFVTSTFKITSVEGNTIKGNLTVRGNTNEETFAAPSISVADGSTTVEGTLVFNRQN